MIKNILYSLLLLGSASTFAQQGSSSPYSYYGLGDIKFRNTNEIKHQGGLSIYKDSIHLNISNPASYSELQLTTFSIGISNKETSIHSASQKARANRTTLDYFAVGIPAGKFGFAFGAMPYSFVGYNIANKSIENNFNVTRKFTGNGGLNRAFAGVSYKIGKRINIGADVGLHFGNTEIITSKLITNNVDNATIDRGTREQIDNNYRGLVFNTGLNYTQPLSKKTKLNIGITYSPETTLENQQSITYTTFIVDQTSGAMTTVDKEDAQTNNKQVINPQKYSIGLGIGDSNKWFAGIEYTNINTEKWNKSFTNGNATYKNNHRFSLGATYTPNNLSFNNRWERTSYRVGFNYQKTGLVLNNHEIKDINATIGIGMPINARSISNVNIGVEYGQRGTKDYNLIRENYFGVSIGLSFNDKWFVKRKYE